MNLDNLANMYPKEESIKEELPLSLETPAMPSRHHLIKSNSYDNASYEFSKRKILDNMKRINAQRIRHRSSSSIQGHSIAFPLPTINELKSNPSYSDSMSSWNESTNRDSSPIMPMQPMKPIRKSLGDKPSSPDVSPKKPERSRSITDVAAMIDSALALSVDF